MKKIISVLLSAVILFGLCLPSYADTADTDGRLNFEYGDYVISYRIFEAEGEKKGSVFMIHGFALSSVCFEPLASRLAANGYECVLADLPDFGYSSRESYSTEKLPREDIMHELMLYLSDEPWYVAGHSMGGYIALALAEKYPESVKNLLLYGTAGNDGVSDSLNALMTNRAFVSVMGRLMQAMGGCRPLVRALWYVATGDFSFAMNYDIAKITEPFAIAGTGEGALYSFSMLPATDFDAVKNMPAILYINGSKDNVISQTDKDKLREYLPQGSVNLVCEGGAHLFIETHADYTAENTLAFLLTNQ